MTGEALITEDDWVKPLVLLRGIAASKGLTLAQSEEQAICRQIVEAMTAAVSEEITARVDALATTARAA